jgi:hypothetical protein
VCNSCQCENYEKCSIVGQIPIGFCCPQCSYYIDGTACERLKEKVQKRAKSHKKEIEVAQKILKKFKISNEKLEKYP